MLSDSSATAQASEVVIGIYHPFREKINKIDNYNVKILGDRIRVPQILKNRFGQSDKNVCVAFYGEIGWFEELPPAEDINDYDNIINLDKHVIEDEPITRVKVTEMDFNSFTI